MQSVLLDSLSIGTIETASRDRQKAWGGGGLQLLPQSVLTHRVGCISC